MCKPCFDAQRTKGEKICADQFSLAVGFVGVRNWAAKIETAIIMSEYSTFARFTYGVQLTFQINQTLQVRLENR